MIPKIIHKVWFDFSKDSSGKLPKQEYIDCENQCQQINKEWTIMRWNEEKALDLITKKYPFFLEHYNNYKYPIQKVDAIRAFILYEYGGVYMDMDINCFREFDIFTEDKIYLVQEINAIPYSFNNFLMASPKKHKFWLTVFDKFKENYNSFWFFKTMHVLQSTGPGLLDTAYYAYKNKNYFIILPNELFNPCNVCGNCLDTSNIYIQHNSNNTWTTRYDQVYLMLLCKRYYIITIIITISLIVFFIYLVKFINIQR